MERKKRIACIVGAVVAVLCMLTAPSFAGGVQRIRQVNVQRFRAAPVQRVQVQRIKTIQQVQQVYAPPQQVIERVVVQPQVVYPQPQQIQFLQAQPYALQIQQSTAGFCH